MIWTDGRYIKDLSYLNRDPKNIIVIEKDPKLLGKYTANGIVLKEYEGGDQDD